MSRWLRLGALSLSLAAAPALAQAPAPAPSAAAAPAAQPAPAGQLPAAPPPVDENAELPPGHPPLQGGGSRSGMPGVPQDRVMPSASVPPGSIHVRVVDGEGKPLPNVPVKLGIVRQSVEEGEQKEFKLVVSDGEGISRFGELERGSRYSYRAVVQNDAAEYASDSFSLRGDAGMDVLLHVFPVTADIRRTMLATQGIVVVSPRDDVFQFEVLLRVYNVGKVTWVPEDVIIDMPAGFKAFTAQEGMSDTRAVKEGENAVRLAGTFSPGQHEVLFRFQVPNDHDPTVTFRLGLPPNLGELRVLSEAARGMSMDVEGMPPAETSTGQGGERLLISSRRLQPGEGQMSDVVIRLSGIPVPSAGRWWAVGLAIFLAAAGLMSALQDRKDKEHKAPIDAKDARRAKDLLMDELVALERARRAKEVGPHTYETARRALVDALARLEAQLPKPSKRKRARA